MGHRNQHLGSRKEGNLKKHLVSLFKLENRALRLGGTCLLQQQVVVSPSGTRVQNCAAPGPTSRSWARGLRSVRTLHSLHTYLVTTLTSGTPSSQPGVTQ